MAKTQAIDPAALLQKLQQLLVLMPELATVFSQLVSVFHKPQPAPGPTPGPMHAALGCCPCDPSDSGACADDLTRHAVAILCTAAAMKECQPSG